MVERTNRETVEAYASAMEQNDIDAIVAMLHPDYVEDYPQSGERVRGGDNLRSIMSNYPGGEPRTGKVERLVGASDQWIVTPMYTSLRVDGAGDEYTAAARVVYPDGSDWFIVQLIQLRDGSIYRTTSYYGQPFEAPAWRSAWVERIPADEAGR
jgi:ketosteroid isomerase-like protein